MQILKPKFGGEPAMDSVSMQYFEMTGAVGCSPAMSLAEARISASAMETIDISGASMELQKAV